MLSCVWMTAAPAYRSLLRQSPARIIGQLNIPVLAVYGGKDTQTPGAEDADAFRNITRGGSSAAVRLFPDHNHLFQRAQTGSISEYEHLPPGPERVVLQAIKDWLLKIQPDAPRP